MGQSPVPVCRSAAVPRSLYEAFFANVSMLSRLAARKYGYVCSFWGPKNPKSQKKTSHPTVRTIFGRKPANVCRF